MNTLFCNHEREYWKNRKAKFFELDQPFGKLCCANGKFLGEVPNEPILIRNRDAEMIKKTAIIKRSLVPPHVANNEEMEHYTVYWK